MPCVLAPGQAAEKRDWMSHFSLVNYCNSGLVWINDIHM